MAVSEHQLRDISLTRKHTWWWLIGYQWWCLSLTFRIKWELWTSFLKFVVVVVLYKKKTFWLLTFYTEYSTSVVRLPSTVAFIGRAQRSQSEICFSRFRLGPLNLAGETTVTMHPSIIVQPPVCLCFLEERAETWFQSFVLLLTSWGFTSPGVHVGYRHSPCRVSSEKKDKPRFKAES